MEYISLSQLTGIVKECINVSFPTGVWIKAEIAQMSVNKTSGHCYLTLIEKGQNGPKAKISANVWRNNFDRISWEFERITNVSISSGIEIVAFVMIDYSPLYGLSLNITKIDATYNLGQLAKQRIENIAKLKSEGVFEMNRGLELCSLPFRVAVVSSATAAGYEDFVHQLESAERRYPFKLKLFNSLMQGDSAPTSILDALSNIADEMDDFDCVIIIRGGGASTDLIAFDDIDVARVCAQFPLPILAGIGHTRDESIIDMVSNMSLKTPTAVADFLLEKADSAFENVENEAQRLNNAVNMMLDRANSSVLNCSRRLPQLCQVRLSAAETNIASLQARMKGMADRRIILSDSALDALEQRVINSIYSRLYQSNEELRNFNRKIGEECKSGLRDNIIELDILTVKIDSSDPARILKKGFTYTEHKGVTVTTVDQLCTAMEIKTYFSDGEVTSIIK